MQVEERDQYLLSKEELENKIATYAGGRAAEELIFGSITTGASNDIEQMTKLARAMITRYGMSDEFGMMALETVNVSTWVETLLLHVPLRQQQSSMKKQKHF